MEIEEVADRVAAAADEVSDAASRLGLVQPGAAGFAGDGPGQLGVLGRDLHSVWSAGLAAREREAAGHGARLTDLAGALRQAADGYRRVEDDAHRRHQGIG
jgi:Excreted virulence factor EspC, type VII ESX diderm